ncbi:MAG: MATE family efflux transporter [Blautia sp.]
MKEFGRTVCKIAVPVTFQSMLQASFSIIDQLMIGQLGSKSIAAVGIGGNFSLIFSVVIGAVATVAGILIAQFLGAKDDEEAWRGFWVSILAGTVVAAIFTICGLFFTRQILRIYTKDVGIVSEGLGYLKLISITFIPMAFSSITAVWLRCREYAFVPLAASFLAVFCNTGLNYGLIFGNFGLPPMGACGAGLATLISQIFNLIFMIFGFVYCIQKEEARITWAMKLKKVTRTEYLAMVMPILLSEFVWSMGQNVFSAVYGHIGTESLAAYTLTTPVQGLFIGAFSGLSAASGVIVGKQLGKKDYDCAYKDSLKMLLLGVTGAVILAVVLICMSGFYVSFYQVENSVKDIAKLILIIFALYAPIKVQNMILGGGIIRSGGNTKIIMMIDIFGTLAVGIPLCLSAAYVWKLSVVWVYGILSAEEIVRFVITVVMFRKKHWMKSIS